MLWTCTLCSESMSIFFRENHLRSKTHAQRQRKSNNDVKPRAEPTNSGPPVWKCSVCDVELSVFYRNKHLLDKAHIKASQKRDLSTGKYISSYTQTEPLPIDQSTVPSGSAPRDIFLEVQTGKYALEPAVYSVLALSTPIDDKATLLSDAEIKTFFCGICDAPIDVSTVSLHLTTSLRWECPQCYFSVHADWKKQHLETCTECFDEGGVSIGGAEDTQLYGPAENAVSKPKGGIDLRWDNRVSTDWETANGQHQTPTTKGNEVQLEFPAETVMYEQGCVPVPGGSEYRDPVLVPQPPSIPKVKPESTVKNGVGTTVSKDGSYDLDTTTGNPSPSTWESYYCIPHLVDEINGPLKQCISVSNEAPQESDFGNLSKGGLPKNSSGLRASTIPEASTTSSTPLSSGDTPRQEPMVITPYIPYIPALKPALKQIDKGQSSQKPTAVQNDAIITPILGSSENKWMCELCESTMGQGEKEHHLKTRKHMRSIRFSAARQQEGSEELDKGRGEGKEEDKSGKWKAKGKEVELVVEGKPEQRSGRGCEMLQKEENKEQKGQGAELKVEGMPVSKWTSLFKSRKKEELKKEEPSQKTVKWVEGWECDICRREMAKASRSAHLSGRKHNAKVELRKREALRNKTSSKPTDKPQIGKEETLKVDEQPKETGENKKVLELRMKEKIQEEKEEQRQAEERVEEERREVKRVEEEAQRQEKERREQKRIEEEARGQEEERREVDRREVERIWEEARRQEVERRKQKRREQKRREQERRHHEREEKEREEKKRREQQRIEEQKQEVLRVQKEIQKREEKQKRQEDRKRKDELRQEGKRTEEQKQETLQRQIAQKGWARQRKLRLEVIWSNEGYRGSDKEEQRVQKGETEHFGRQEPEKVPQSQAATCRNSWDCTICTRTMSTSFRKSHLSGQMHHAKRLMEEERLKKVVEMQRIVKEVQKQEEERKGNWKCTVCDRSLWAGSRKSYLAGGKHRACKPQEVTTLPVASSGLYNEYKVYLQSLGGKAAQDDEFSMLRLLVGCGTPQDYDWETRENERANNSPPKSTYDEMQASGSYISFEERKINESAHLPNGNLLRKKVLRSAVPWKITYKVPRSLLQIQEPQTVARKTSRVLFTRIGPKSSYCECGKRIRGRPWCWDCDFSM